MAFSTGGAGAKTATPQLNVTPLVDVALVVLIIFMIVAPMLTKTFTLTLPSEAPAAAASAPSDEPLVLTIDVEGALQLNRQAVEPSALAAELRARLAKSEQKVLSVEAADELPYGRVIEVVDRCRAAGATSIAMVTKKRAQR